jgi:hypothetical protein
LRLSAIAMILFCLTVAALAETDGRNARFDDPLLDNLTGRWDAPGQVVGRPTASMVTADWVLNHQFLQLKLEDAATRSASCSNMATDRFEIP